MKQLHNERGYTFFLTLIILLLFSILSVSLITFTVTGAKRSAIREDVTQASELAEKGIQHIVQEINREIEEGIGNDGLTRDAFKTKLESILKDYLCETGSEFVSPLDNPDGRYHACIESYKNQEDSNGNKNELRKKVTFRSEGNVNDRSKTTHSIVEIGSSSVPEVLKYAVGTNIKSPNPRNGEGNLLLHGGVEITGDIKVDGNLVTYEKGTGAYRWLESTLPRVKPLGNSGQSRLVIGKNMYLRNTQPYTGNESNHTTYLNNNNFNDNNDYTKVNNPSELFYKGYSPRVIKRNPVPLDINIRDYKNNYYFDQSTSGINKERFDNGKIINKDLAEKWVLPYARVCNWFNNCNHVYTNTISLEGNNKFGRLAIMGETKIREGKHHFSEGFYGAKGLTIGNPVSNPNGNTRRDDVTLEGTMYVDGKVSIQAANLKADAMLYVDGDVEIRFSTIEGLKSGNDTGTLIIFSTGNIFIANISENEDSPSDINGYFYSDKFLELYGVGSNVRIKGGIAANRVVLNALRGRVRSTSFSGWYKRESSVGYYESPSNQANRDSRLQIIYDPELVENYLKLNPPEPIIYDIDPPKLIDRNLPDEN